MTGYACVHIAPRLHSSVNTVDGKKISLNDVCNACGGYAVEQNVGQYAGQICNFFTPAIIAGATQLGFVITGVRRHLSYQCHQYPTLSVLDPTY